MKIKLGDKVKCEITGFTGIATVKAEYLSGCIQYGIRSKVSKDGKMTEIEYIDVQNLRVVGGKKKITKSDTGGSNANAPKGYGLSR